MSQEKSAGRQTRMPHPRHVHLAPTAATPTAVAIHHEIGDIPTVVASGTGAIAEKILEIAFANGIKVREDADLVQLLSAIEIDCPIPINCFEAVAEVLNYLYRANGDVPPPADELINEDLKR